jgi:hypothetical protein
MTVAASLDQERQKQGDVNREDCEENIPEPFPAAELRIAV